MRVALLGWDLPAEIGDALAALAVDLTAFTRWFPGLPHSEIRRGWTLHRCPHQIGGGPAAEADSFWHAVLARRSELGDGLARFDVVHALDAMARPAAAGLAQRQATSLRVWSITAQDLLTPSESLGVLAADVWIADHPAAADLARWKFPDRRLAIVPTLESLRPPPPASVRTEAGGPLVVYWVSTGAEIDAEAIERAVVALRSEVPDLRVQNLGYGHAAEQLRRRLLRVPGLGHEENRIAVPAPETWSSWISTAAVVGLASSRFADDPIAWAAWLAGVPVVPLGTMPWPGLAQALGEALHDRARFERDVRAGAALASARLGPAGIALGWLRVYLDGVSRGAELGIEETSAALEAHPFLPRRTQLSLLPIGHREAYASWYVRPEDRAVALEWLGTDSVRSTLALRLQDITDLTFHGSNAHAIWDVDLGPAERYRTVSMSAPGRSLVASLGLRSMRGAFVPLAHAGPTHLPRESEAPDLPRRRLRALPRS